MASWSYENGVFRPVSIPFRSTPASAAVSLPSSSAPGGLTYAVQGSFAVGDFVEVTPNFTPVGPLLTPPLVSASHRSPTVVGVVKRLTGAQQAEVAERGLCYAWVVPGDYTPPLSGYYDKAVNGVHQCRVVIDVQGDAFTIAATKDDEVEQLTARFDALTSAPT